MATTSTRRTNEGIVGFELGRGNTHSRGKESEILTVLCVFPSLPYKSIDFRDSGLWSSPSQIIYGFPLHRRAGLEGKHDRLFTRLRACLLSH